MAEAASPDAVPQRGPTDNKHVRMRGSAMDQDIRGVTPLQAQHCQPLRPLELPLEPPTGTRAELKPELHGRRRQLQTVAVQQFNNSLLIMQNIILLDGHLHTVRIISAFTTKSLHL